MLRKVNSNLVFTAAMLIMGIAIFTISARNEREARREVSNAYANGYTNGYAALKPDCQRPRFYDGEGNHIPDSAVVLLVQAQFCKMDSASMAYLNKYFYEY